MPSPFRQLILIVKLDIRDLARIPAAILFVSEQSGPKAFEVVARFGVDALHFPQEKILQHLLIEFFWMLVDGLAFHREDCARLEADRVGRSFVTEVVEEVFEVLRRRLEGFFALECTLW